MEIPLYFLYSRVTFKLFLPFVFILKRHQFAKHAKCLFLDVHVLEALEVCYHVQKTSSYHDLMNTLEEQTEMYIVVLKNNNNSVMVKLCCIFVAL